MVRTILALLLVALPALSTGQSDAPVRRPEIRVGDSWTYRSTNIIGPGTHEHVTRVTFANDKVILAVSTRKSDGKEFDSSWTSEWNAVSSYTGVMYKPPTGILRFPLRIGETYSIKFDAFRPRESAVMAHTTGTATVIGWEMVEVPAGKFRAIKVAVEALYQPSDGSRDILRKFTFWYNPEVRRWVKLYGEWAGGWLNEELLEYKLSDE